MFCQTFHVFNIFPSLKKVKVGSPKHLISNFGSKPTTKLLNPMILFASFYMSRTVWIQVHSDMRLSNFQTVALKKGRRDDIF